MAKIWHKVMGRDGYVVYRASASRQYASYNPLTGSFSSKMLLGNVPVEVLAKAPRVIKVKGSAWGVEVVRSYMEGERPVTHTTATRGRGEQVNWEAVRAAGITQGLTTSGYREQGFMQPADPLHVWVRHDGYTDKNRASNVEYVARQKAEIAAAGGADASGTVDAMIVELA